MNELLPSPHITALNDKEQIQQMRSYLFQLKESLEFILTNIGKENLSAPMLKELQKIGVSIEEVQNDVDMRQKTTVGLINESNLTVSDVIESALFEAEKAELKEYADNAASEAAQNPGEHTHTKDEVGLGNVDNTADADKSVKHATSATNADTLDGHDSEYFATVDNVKNNDLWTSLTSGFDLNNALGKYATNSGTIVGSLLNKPSDVSGGEISVDWFSSDTWNRYGTQVLRQHLGGTSRIYIRAKNNTTWNNWTLLATTADLANYASSSHTHTKSEITDFPTSIPPSAHTHAYTTVTDTRSDNQTPEWYLTNHKKMVVNEFKSTSAIGLSGETYANLTTYIPWGDKSGGYPKQVALCNGVLHTRVGISLTEWSAWSTLHNTVIVASDPGEGATVSYPEGTIIYVKG